MEADLPWDGTTMAVRSSETITGDWFAAHGFILDEGTHGGRKVRHYVDGYALGMLLGYLRVVDSKC
jgi:hypothetical protein